MGLRIFIVLIFSIVFVMCGKEKTTDKESDSAKTSTTDSSDTDLTGVNLSGSLTVIGGTSEASLYLADPNTTMDVFCSTKDATPKTCTIPIDDKGAFETSCKDLAGSPFSCFLRENSIVVGDILFDDKPHLTAGLGDVHMAASVDADTGSVSTEVDAKKSDALATDALTKAGVDEKVETSFESSLKGEWTVSCDDDDSEAKTFQGQSSCPDKSKIYLAEATGYTKEKQIYSVWKSKIVHDACVPADSTTYSETKPYWHVTVGGDATKIIPFDFTTLELFATSMDQVYSALPTDLKSSLDEVVTAIYLRARNFKAQVNSVRGAVADSKFGGVLEYRIPDKTELRQRILLQIIYLDVNKLSNMDYCPGLLNDETFLAAYRRIHSVVPEMVCQYRGDNHIAALKDFVTKTFDASCLPKIFYDVVFNPTKKLEEVVLRCPGTTKVDGSCFETDGKYAGDMHGRYNIMEMKTSVDNVFDLSQKRTLELQVVHPKQGLKTCKIQNESVIKAKKISESLFEGTFSDHFVDRCEGSGASEQERDFYGDLTETQISRYAQTWKASFERVP